MGADDELLPPAAKIHEDDVRASSWTSVRDILVGKNVRTFVVLTNERTRIYLKF